MPTQNAASVVRRPGFVILSVAALGGSYFIMKSQTMKAKSEQRPKEGDFNVNPSRSGGGI
ncbi:hypothetical protein K490DRAFT_69451 [Saccharata proteae CBS 121410]|uniref:Uncharacterized protein n=1 Tax=Saccharata proteae CBS 121410 TaxID=1314787 RepID=A0A9P4LW98_9PEZI|nr:hypothetical protein K490DRAFT_69451 [Saccharata proteae CBS 121410]